MTDHETSPNSGLSKVRLQLRDDDGRVTETIEVQEHVCREFSCYGAAHCESCGGTGFQRILLIGSTEDGMDIFVCYPCLAEDDYCQTEADPSRCDNSWHGSAIPGRPCAECPQR